VGQLGPVELEEADGSKKARGENGADSENLMAHDEAAQHLRVHALEGIGAEDCFIGACIQVVWVVGSVFELLALVVASQHWTCH